MLFEHLLLVQSNASSGDVIAGIFVLILLALFVGVFIWSLFWAYQDAEERGKSGCLVVLLILLVGWPISLLLWVVFRPG
jgi:uncharacterized membrane protein